MMRTNVPITMRALRVRRNWRQGDLGERAGLSRDAVSRAELGRLGGLTVASLDRLCGALDATLVLEIRWRGAALDRLIDRVHARLQDEVARRLTAAGWMVRPEVTFNHYGDRGSCDLVGWHPTHRILLIVEVKSRMGDIQETLHRLDTKVRLGSIIAAELGYGTPSSVARALALVDDSTNRRVVARHPALFESFAVRGRSAGRWLRSPTGIRSGLLCFHNLSGSKRGPHYRCGAHQNPPPCMTTAADDRRWADSAVRAAAS